VLLGFDRQGWITVFAALLLALITLFTNYTHVDLPQQAGIPCIAAAVATAIEQQAQCNLVQPAVNRRKAKSQRCSIRLAMAPGHRVPQKPI
jgi:hypothetical protein